MDAQAFVIRKPKERFSHVEAHIISKAGSVQLELKSRLNIIKVIIYTRYGHT